MQNGYHPLSKFFHWAIVLLVLVQFVNSDSVPRGHGTMSTDVILNSHFSFGLLILPIVPALLFMRFFRPVEKNAEETDGLAGMAATAMHYALYVLIIVVPLAGWAAANGRGFVLNFFNLFNLPELIAQGSQYARIMGEAHSGLAGLLGFLIAGHVGAALYHHYVLKDTVLRRMLPKFFS